MTVTRTARALQNAAAGGWQGAPIGASRASIGRAGSSLHRANEPRPVYGFMGLGRGSRYDHHIWSTLGSPSRRTRRVRRALRAGAREADPSGAPPRLAQIGRASGRARVGQDVLIRVE